MLEENKRLVIDGSCGLITDDLASAKISKGLLQNIKAGKVVLMGDSEPVNFLASVRQATAAGKARELGANAIGLVRSEFLLSDNGQGPDK